jgi:uncharacterized protein (TIGR00725 family)
VPRRYFITVIGKSAKDPNDPVPPAALRAAEEVGREVAKRGGVVISGGLSGVMEAVSRGAKDAGGLTVGLLPGYEKEDANQYVDIPIATGMGFMRNTLTVRAADAVIMISGGIGTLNELTVAYENKPTIVLLGTGEWADRLPEVAFERHYLDQAKIGYLHYAKSAAEAVELAFRLVREGWRPRRAIRMRE